MTFQPPPPPQGPQGQPPQGQPPQGPPPQGMPPQGPPQGAPQQGPPPGPPPGGQWGPPPGQPARPGGSFDPKSVNQLDWGILGAGLLAFIFSLFSYYSYSAKDASVVGGSLSTSAWNGFFGWFAALLAIVGSAALALEIFMPHVKLPFPNRLVGLAAYAVATLSVILAIFVVPDYLGGGPGYDAAVNEGHGFAYWISLIVIVAGLVLSFMRFQQTGGQLPIGGGMGRPGGPRPGSPPPPPNR